MASELCKEYIAQNDELANKNDMTALFRIGYGLYVVTSNDGKKDNGLIVNTVTQLTDTPNRIAVNINKAKLLPPCDQTDRSSQRKLPVCRCTVLCIPAVWFPDRTQRR